MLLENVLKRNDVITVKLTSGEEMLASLWEDSAEVLTVSKPAVIARSPDGGMGMIPWVMTSASEKFPLNKNTIITYTATDPEIAKAYTETTTGLQLPK